MKAGHRTILAVLASSVVLTAAAASAQELRSDSETNATSSLPAVVAMEEAGEEFEIVAGHSVLLQAAEPLGTVIIGDDTIANATVGAGNSLIVTGLATGSTNLIVLTEGDETLMASKVAVVPVTGRLRSTVTVTKGSEIGEQYECRGNGCKPLSADRGATEIPLMLMATPAESTSTPAPSADQSSSD